VIPRAKFGQAVKLNGLDRVKPFDLRRQRATIMQFISTNGKVPTVEQAALIAASASASSASSYTPGGYVENNDPPYCGGAGQGLL
jgi:hypothetical protein